MRTAVPERTCAGCGVKSGKDRLLRICASSGEITIDQSGRAPGRGAYVCKDVECARRARKKDSLSRSLRASVPLRIYDDVEALCEGAPGSENDRK